MKKGIINNYQLYGHEGFTHKIVFVVPYYLACSRETSKGIALSTNSSCHWVMALHY